MKTQMLTNLVTATLLTCGVAHSDSSNVEQLWSEDAKENTWKLVEVQIPGLTGEIKAYQTDNGEYKLDRVGEQMFSSTTIESNQFARYQSQEQFLNSCEQSVKAYPPYRRLKLPYSVKMQVLSTQTQDLNFTAMTTEGARALKQLATTYLPLTVFELHIATTPTADLFKTGDLDLPQLESQLLAQVTNQRDAIERTGQVVLNLDGYEDVVCDLLAGRAKIRLLIQLNYSAAKLEHKTRIDEGQMSTLVSRLTSTWKPTQSTHKNELNAARLIYQAVDELKLRSPLSDDEYDRLQDLLFDPNSGDFACPAATQIKTVTERMDTLAPGMTYSLPIYESQLVSPFQAQSRPQ